MNRKCRRRAAAAAAAEAMGAVALPSSVVLVDGGGAGAFLSSLNLGPQQVKKMEKKNLPAATAAASVSSVRQSPSTTTSKRVRVERIGTSSVNPWNPTKKNEIKRTEERGGQSGHRKKRICGRLG